MIDYKTDMIIDPDQLDIELLQQASLAHKYAENMAKLKDKVRRLEQKIKVARAEAIRHVNKDPVKCTGKDKPAGHDVEAYYRSRKEHKQLKEQWLKACYEAEYAEMAYKEISFTRKSALENLVRLHGMEYFAGPDVPRDLSNIWKKRQKRNKSNEVVNSAIKRTNWLGI